MGRVCPRSFQVNCYLPAIASHQESWDRLDHPPQPSEPKPRQYHINIIAKMISEATPSCTASKQTNYLHDGCYSNQINQLAENTLMPL